MTKALTFIQAWKAPIKEVFSIHEYYDLVSQEFKPEMIVEYFEGWSTYGSGVYNLNWGPTGYDAQYTFQKGWADINGEGYPEAKTLDQFISDCQRSGIELNWKEEVSKKFR